MNILKRFKSSASAVVAAKNDLNLALTEIRSAIAELAERRETILRARMSAEEIGARVKAHLDHLERDALARRMRRLRPIDFSVSATR